MEKRSGSPVAARCVAAILVSLGVQAVQAAPTVANTPSSASATYRYLPPTARYPSGLDRTVKITPPPVDGHDLGIQALGTQKKAAGPDKNTHLPVKPVTRTKVNAGYHPLVSLEDQ